MPRCYLCEVNKDKTPQPEDEVVVFLNGIVGKFREAELIHQTLVEELV